MRSFLATFVAVLALAAGLTAHAATFENASRLVAAAGLEAEIDRAIGDAVAAVRAQLSQQSMPAEKIDAFLAAFRDELEEAAPGLVADLTREYADRFSDAEIEDLIEFYETPTGRKLVETQHDLALAQAQAVANWITAAAQSAASKLQNSAKAASV